MELRIDEIAAGHSIGMGRNAVTSYSNLFDFQFDKNQTNNHNQVNTNNTALYKPGLSEVPAYSAGSTSEGLIIRQIFLHFRSFEVTYGGL